MIFMLLRAGLLPMFWWYDINCRYSAHALAWAAACSGVLLTVAQADWVKHVMRFPLPPWHHYMHNLFCQRRNSFRRMLWAGVGHGEPLEILWSKLRGMGHLLQGASLAARHVALERAVALWNRKKRSDLPNLLGRMFYRAKIRKAEADARVTAMQNEMRKMWDAAATPEERATLEHQMAEMRSNPPNMESEDSTAALELEAEYVQLIMVAGVIASSDTAAGGQVDLLIEGPTAAKLKPESAFAHKTVKRLAEVKQALGIVEDWSRDSPEFKAGWASYVVYRLRKQQSTVALAQINIALLQYLFKKFQGRRGDVKKLEKTRDREYGRFSASLVILVRLSREVRVAVEAVNQPSTLLGRGKKEAEAILAVAKEGKKASELKDLYGSILKGEFPWFDLLDEAAVSPVERYRVPFHMALWEYERAQEEMQLVRAEMEGLVCQFDKEIEAMHAAIARHKAVVDAQANAVPMDVEESAEVAAGAGEADDRLLRPTVVDPLATGVEGVWEGAWEDRCKAQQAVREAEAAKSSIAFLMQQVVETEGLKKAAQVWLEQVAQGVSTEFELGEMEQVLDVALEEFMEPIEAEEEIEDLDNAEDDIVLD